MEEVWQLLGGDLTGKDAVIPMFLHQDTKQLVESLVIYTDPGSGDVYRSIFLHQQELLLSDVGDFGSTVDVLEGGGGGGGLVGGGGAGGFHQHQTLITATSPINIGAGGAGGSADLTGRCNSTAIFNKWWKYYRIFSNCLWWWTRCQSPDGPERGGGPGGLVVEHQDSCYIISWWWIW